MPRFTMGERKSRCAYEIESRGETLIALITLDEGTTFTTDAETWERFLAQFQNNPPTIHWGPNSRGRRYLRITVNKREEMLARVLHRELAERRVQLSYIDGDRSNLTSANLSPRKRKDAAKAAGWTGDDD